MLPDPPANQLAVGRLGNFGVQIPPPCDIQPLPSPNDTVNAHNPLLIFRTITRESLNFLLSSHTYPLDSVVSADFVATCIVFATEHSQGSTISLTDTDSSELSLHDDSVSSSFPPYSVSKVEAMFNYLGLCSSPRFVYRMGTTLWRKSTGLEAYCELKELHPVFVHKLNIVWKDLGPKVCQPVDSQGVLWMSIDAVCFIKVREREAIDPVILWIGLPPDILFGKDAHTLVSGCLDLLEEFNITDVEVKYWKSTYTRSTGPNLCQGHTSW
ncbi:hypothetical protein ID866_5144 [Astraeus odoratus]|nr:hypothetical protein ID866_5144 [Astraeus odoratus]